MGKNKSDHKDGEKRWFSFWGVGVKWKRYIETKRKTKNREKVWCMSWGGDKNRYELRERNENIWAIEKEKQRNWERSVFLRECNCICRLLHVHTPRAAAKLNSGSSALAPLPNLQLTSPPEPQRKGKKKQKQSLQKPSDGVLFIDLTSGGFVSTLCLQLCGEHGEM